MDHGCGFICKYQDNDGECEAQGGICITDMCPEYRQCDCCMREEDCEE